jgi:hypothetical protein
VTLPKSTAWLESIIKTDLSGFQEVSVIYSRIRCDEENMTFPAVTTYTRSCPDPICLNYSSFRNNSFAAFWRQPNPLMMTDQSSFHKLTLLEF